MTGIRHSIAYDITLTDASGAYTGAAKVAIPVPDAWNAAPQHLRAYVQESDGSYSRIPGAYADGIYTASVPISLSSFWRRSTRMHTWRKRSPLR